MANESKAFRSLFNKIIIKFEIYHVIQIEGTLIPEGNIHSYEYTEGFKFL